MTGAGARKWVPACFLEIFNDLSHGEPIIIFNLAPETRREFQQNYKAAIAIGIFYLAVGFWVLRHPVFSILDLTLVIGILFFIEGAIQVINAFELRPTQNRGLLLASGIIGIILGILIWSNWPFDSLTLLGLLVGSTT